MPYIPHGADHQGRRDTGFWLPRRSSPADFVDTYPTGPAPLEPAHGCYEQPEDRITTAGTFWIGYAAFIVAVLLAVFVLVTQ